jgi:hypothetical protein
MKQLIIVKPGTMKSDQIEMLKEHNVIVVEHDAPNEVKVMSIWDGMEGDDFIGSLMHTVTYSPSTHSTFVKNFFEKIRNRLIKQVK